MSILDNVFSFFVEETNDHLCVLEEGLLELEKNPSAGGGVIEPIFRAAHTLKGSAHLVNVNDVGVIAHRLEDILEEIRDGLSLPTEERISAMLFSLDQIRTLVHRRQQGELTDDRLVSAALGRLAEADNPDLKSVTARNDGASDPSDSRHSLAQGKRLEAGEQSPEPVRRSDEAGVVRIEMEQIEALMGLVGEFTIAKNHLLNRLPVIRQMRSEVDSAGERLLTEVAGFSERYEYTLPEQASLRPEDSFHELEFDRYDELNLFSRKLREMTDDINEALKEIGGFFNSFTKDIESLDRMTEEIKERISVARTVQASQLFQRFNRPIRDLSQQLERPVELSIVGGETAIDRVIYDGLYDPLLHIVRNAFAHGIESVEERLASDKPAKANIRMKAERRGNTVEILVEDDGRGIDLQRVRQRAVEKGFIGAADQLSEQELTQLIFRPGFSTTETVDADSGRGVGMSVVMDRLAHFSGTIDVWSRPGIGSRFRLRLPLSLVIVNVIKFVCCGQNFVIPSALVEEIVDLEYEAKHQEKLAERPPIDQIDLAALLELPQRQTQAGFGIITQAEGAPVQLLVDEVLGQEDTVIKPFGSFLQELPHVSGSSLSGDGSMRLVINPARMKYAEVRSPALVVATEPLVDSPKVLIVDDSLSVRKYAALLLKQHNYSVITATNGLDALNILENESIFSLVTDLEMPIMHGYELMRELQRRNIKVPVAVLTSRAGEQHREKAMSLGATDYLVKPFDEDALLKLVGAHEAMAQTN